MHYTRALLIERATDSKRYKFRASTGDIARDGMAIPADSWDLTNYRRNPVVLLGHDYSTLPIGRAEVDIDAEGLIADVEFDHDDPMAQAVMRKIDRGMLGAMSVGFQIHAWRQATPPTADRTELLEASIVAVPADPGALVMRSLREILQTTTQTIPEPVESRSQPLSVLASIRAWAADATVDDAATLQAIHNTITDLQRLVPAPEYRIDPDLLARVRGMLTQ